MSTAIIIAIFSALLFWVFWKMGIEPLLCILGLHRLHVLTRLTDHVERGRISPPDDAEIARVVEACARCKETKEHVMTVAESNAWIAKRGMSWSPAGDEKKEFLREVYGMHVA